jgi:hypothetical protein
VTITKQNKQTNKKDPYYTSLAQRFLSIKIISIFMEIEITQLHKIFWNHLYVFLIKRLFFVIDPRVAALMAKFEEEEGEVKQEQQLPKANLPKNLEEFLAAEKLVR